MAKDFETKKRKASTPGSEAEKLKKTKNVADAPAKKRKATDDAAPVKAKKSKTPTESTTTDAPVGDKVNKASKSIANGTSDSKVEKKVEGLDTSAKKTIKAERSTADPLGRVKSAVPESGKSFSKKEKAAQNIEDEEEEEDDSESEEDIDDQTAALLKGFESDGDDEEVEGEYTGQETPKLEDNEKFSKKKEKKLKKALKFAGQGKPGVVYVGRIPHGFHEHEMKSYFSQFGTILKLRLSRNRKTGASKHFAFIKFESATVADIVAKTMDNYLMFGHLLKVKLIPEEQVPADVFKGANKRFKKVPWNKIEGRKLEQGASEEAWDGRANNEQKRRDKKAEKLKEIGYTFDSPKIKSAKDVGKEKPVPELTNDDVEMIEAAPVTEESSKPKKNKKKSKAAKEIESAAAVEEPTKSGKEEKSISAKPSEEDIDALISETVEKSTKKEKKDKKKTKEVGAPGLKDQEIKPTKVESSAEPSSKPKKDKKKKKAKVDAE